MIAPRYLPRLSEDNTAWDLFAPASDEDQEVAAARMLPSLAARQWHLSRRARLTLSRLRREWGPLGTRPVSAVKQDLLRLALCRLVREMYEWEAVRFGKDWYRHSREPVRPADWVFGKGGGESEDDSFDLSNLPTAEDVDRFARWTEQRLIGYAREALDEMAPYTLDDGLRWRDDGSDVLDQGRGVTVSETEIDGFYDRLRTEPPVDREASERWEAQFHSAMHALGRILTRAQYLGLLAYLEGMYADRSEGRHQRLSDRDLMRVQKHVKKIAERHREQATPLVVDAIRAIRELAACDSPPRSLDLVLRRHTRSPRTRRVRAR